MTKVFWGGQAFVVSKIYLLKIEKSHCAHLKEKQWSSVQLPIHERLKFHMDVSAGGRESQTCLIVMLKLCTCSLVRPPKASPPPHLRVSDLFILIYSFISLQISMFHSHSFAVFTALMILGMYGGALLKAKRYSALKSMSFEKKNWRIKCWNTILKKTKLYCTCWLWVKSYLVVSLKKKKILWPLVQLRHVCCMNVLLWVCKRVSDFVYAYHLHYAVMAYLFLRKKMK